MRMMKVNQKKAGVLLSYAYEAITIITGLIYTPLMLRILGQNEYGLYQLVYSVVSYLGLLSMGFGSSYMRFYSGLKEKRDDLGIAKLNGMFMIIFMVISVICILCGVFMVINIQYIFGSGLSNLEYRKAQILMIMMVLSMAITFPNSVFNCNLIAHEEFVFQRALLLVQSILNPFLSLPLLFMGYGSAGIVLISTVLTIVCFIINIIYGIQKLKIQFYFRGFDFRLLKEMWVFTFFIFLGQIIDQINWSVDKFLVGRMVGTSAVAIYGIGGQINSMYLQFSTTISNVFVPTVNRIVSKNDDNKLLTELFTRVGRIQFFVMGLILSGFVLIGRQFIILWAGVGYYKSYYIALFLIIPVTIPLIQNLGIEIQRAKNMHKSRSVVYLIIAVLNILISIPLIRAYEAIGAAIGTAVSLFLGNILFMNWYYHSRIGLDMVFFWRNIVRVVPSVIIPFLLGILYIRAAPVTTVFEVMLFTLAYTVIYFLSIWFFSFNEYEKDLIISMIRKVYR